MQRAALAAMSGGVAPRRLDLFQRAASGLGHADDDPDEADHAEGGEQPERVRLPDRLHQRQEECADEERRAPVDRGRHRHGPSTNLVWIDLVDDCPCDRASRECERDDENDKRAERDHARRASEAALRPRLPKREADHGKAERHADEARDQERAPAEAIDEGDRDEGREHVDRADPPGGGLGLLCGRRIARGGEDAVRVIDGLRPRGDRERARPSGQGQSCH